MVVRGDVFRLEVVKIKEVRIDCSGFGIWVGRIDGEEIKVVV